MKPGERTYNKATDKQWSSEVYHNAKQAIGKTLPTAKSGVQFDSICEAVKQHHPSLCIDNIRDPRNPRSPYWKHLVASAIQELKKKGKLRKSDEGWIWTGLKSPPDGPDKLAEQIKGLLEKLVELAKQKKEEIPHLTHDEVVDKITEIAKMLDKVVDPVPGAPYKHDCVWRDNPYANPKIAVEVCDKGNLDKDIASLIWAVKNWSASGILVLFEESDFRTAQKKLAQESQIYPLKLEDALNLHSLLQAGYAQAIRSIFSV